MALKSITLTTEEMKQRIATACRSLSRKKFTPKQLSQFIIKGKVPNETKRTKTGYLLFLDDFRKEFSKEERAKVGQVAKKGAAAWKELDKDDKQHYLDKAAKLKEANKITKKNTNAENTNAEKTKSKTNDSKKIYDPDDWSDIEDAVDDCIPEGWDLDDWGGLNDGDITWREDGKYFHEENKEWILPKKTPKGEKIPKCPQEIKDFYEGAIFQTWKKTNPQAVGHI